jgi:cobalt-zinc-cadmium efflux system outer membrane protein
MAWRARPSNYLVVTLLIIPAGCALPNGRPEPTSAVAVASAGQMPPTGDLACRSSSAMIPMVSLASHVAPADTRPDPPQVTDEPVPVPEEIFSDPTRQPSDPVWSSQGISAPSPDSLQPRLGTDDPADPFGNQKELSVEQLVAEVHARNPSLQAASYAWRAAAQRYPQAISLDDPMFGFMIGPNGVGMDDGGGWMVQASQEVPWPGKRALRGKMASAEADAMKGDVGDARLRLSAAARTAFYDYYLARRELDVNASTRQLLTEFRENASNKYQTGGATEQDVLLADVELAGLESRRIELARDEQVAMARINTLLHRVIDHPLPPPPTTVSLPDSLPAAEVLQQMAIQSRPDLYALQARIRAEQANVALACQEYYPDVNLVAKYDGFMPEEMRPQVGLDFNVPMRDSGRSAAVREASHRVAQRCAEYEDRLDQIRYEVQSALARASESQRVFHLYEETILPAAQRSLDSALANYISGKLDFLRLLDTGRQLNAQREMYYQTIAEYHRRLAELERAVGQTVLPGL